MKILKKHNEKKFLSIIPVAYFIFLFLIWFSLVSYPDISYQYHQLSGKTETAFDYTPSQSSINILGPGSQPTNEIKSTDNLSETDSTGNNAGLIKPSFQQKTIGFMKSTFIKIANLFKTLFGFNQLGNFKPIETISITIGLLFFGILLIIGIIKFKHYFDNPTILANFIFCAIVSFITLMVIAYAKFITIRRVFEFTYIAFIPFVALGAYFLYKKMNTILNLLLVLILFLIFMSGNLLVVGGQQRYLYPTDEKITLESSMIFLSPSTVQAALWYDDYGISNDLLGDSLIFDSVGAYGSSNVHYYETQLLNQIYRSNKISSRGYSLLKWDRIQYISTHKYMRNYSSGKVPELTDIQYEKFTLDSKLNKIYDDKTIQFFFIKPT
jgi:hypothetical protein